MQLATIRESGLDVAVALDPPRGLVRLTDLTEPIEGGVLDVLASVPPDRFVERVAATPADRFSPTAGHALTAPYRRPHKIWGIGLNYRAHADDLGAGYPDEPASFIKADHTVIGPGEPIPLPRQSHRVTAEAELGLVIGSYTRDVAEQDAVARLWGVCPVLDQTAEDILQRNPRFLTRSKNFPGFFSFGPGITPIGEVLARFGSLAAIEVATVRNGEVWRSGAVADMIFGPEFLVSFHSRVMPLYPGDIISSGTPGAAVIADGDTAECRIAGIGVLSNPVSG
ncbi:fumarylacetoacetate hydrolase family protein [Actinacidiphila sp. ITFR-21]|uniref:fumarylacetoacetate hydrolase family protein n=1 Tax=Actinacidiphila sp. ITFR-21 TaxID=3075199 RepID=UPI00288B157C|nr:fumarylacetoacetate hydrolase family protein [Streptomyces sp. ITFR-21]WNI16471.1 fumarylacetoacetate hydrolase family protein [Streptomyces sp. ITFR-21]